MTIAYYFDMGTVNGKRQKKEKGGFATRKEAESALAKAITEYETGGQVFLPSEITVSDFLDLWFDQYARMNFKYNTQLDYAATITNHLKPAFGKYRLCTLGASVIQDYVNKLKVDGYAKATVKNILGTLSSAFRYAVEPMHYVQFNPCDNVRIPRYEKAPQETHHFIRQDEMDRILERFPFPSPYYLPIMIGYHCGLRISECFGLSWDRIDLNARTVTVDRQVIKRDPSNDAMESVRKGKTRRQSSDWYLQSTKTTSSVRTIRFGQTLLDALKAARMEKLKNRMRFGSSYLEQYISVEKDERGDDLLHITAVPRSVPVDLEAVDLVCVKPDGSLCTSDSFKYACRVITHDLHIPFNYHSLRHTHATMLVQAGAYLKDVQARLGHANIATTMNSYVHDTEDMQLRTVDLFEKAISSRMA